MAAEILKFENLAEVDHGSVAVAMDEAIVSAYKDILDRATVEEARKVTLEIKLKPARVNPDSRDVEYVVSEFAIKKAFPAKGTAVMMAAKEDGMQFQTGAPDNPDQTTLEYPKDDD